MSILSKIAIIIAMLIMPIGLLMAVEGNYFHDITSKEKISSLMDASVEEMFQSQISSYAPYCETYNLSCSSLSEVKRSVCKKSAEFTSAADNQSAELCDLYNLSCTDTAGAELAVCDMLGNDDQTCKQLNTLSYNINQAHDSCNQLKDYETQLAAAKETAYNQEMNGFSISKLNAALENSLVIGAVLLLFSIAVTYLASRSTMTVLRSVSFTLLTSGITMLVIGYFGFSIMDSMISSSLPAETAANMPAALTDFAKGIFDFQTYVGEILTAFGIVGFVAIIAIGKFYFKPDKKKN